MYNVIYIHTHDSGRLTGAYGIGPEDSEIKKFAKDALLFQQAYCTNPTCSPSRSSLLTGLYPHENGMLGLANRGFKFNDYKQHLVTILKEQGYKTALSGIQHEAGRYTDHEIGAKTIGYDYNLSVDYDMNDQSMLHIWDQKNAKQLNRWLKEYDQKNPLFLSYGLFTTHRPFPVLDLPLEKGNYVSVPSTIANTSDTRDDYAMYLDSLRIADTCFGSVIDTLKEVGMYDNSIIVFTTDHGIAMPFSKGTLFDAGIGVSFIMRTPKMRRKGISTDSLISQVDFVPTIVDLLQIEEKHQFSGKSFAKLFEDESLEIRDEVFATLNFHTSYEPIRAIRTKRYKYIKYFDDYLGRNLSNIDASPVKDLYLDEGLKDRPKERENLFDLYYDPNERNNLADDPQYLEILETLRLRLKENMESTHDPLLNGKIEKKKEWKVNKVSAVVASSPDPDEYLED